MMESTLNYVGNELDVFSHAKNWKSYWGGFLSSYLGAEVLEVGAGIGANTELLCSDRQSRWVCLEPDRALVQRLSNHLKNHPRQAAIEARQGTLAAVSSEEAFDTILYIDVLEHIKDDRQEMERAGRLLRRGGSLIVLAPAHQWLYSPFDKSIGHYRRYSRKSLAAVAPNSLKMRRLIYLDSVGMLASSANALLLRQAMPTLRQIQFWDRWLVPMSRRIDAKIGFSLGKSVVGVWVKP
jgi:SAM-dependent methyltransferase